MRATFRKQALGDRPHPPCTTPLGPQDTGQVWCCPLHLKGGRGLPGWGPGPLISSLTMGCPTQHHLCLSAALSSYFLLLLASRHWYLGSWALSPSPVVGCPWACVCLSTLISSCPEAPSTLRDTFPGLPQPAFHRAVQALRVTVLPVSCLLFFPHSALNLPPGPHFPREAETGGLGVLHPGTSGLRPAPVDRGSWVEGRMSWKSLRPVSWASQPTESVQGGSDPCLEGSGGADRAGQRGRGPPAPALLRAPRLSRQPELLTSSCAGLHLNPPSCLISKANKPHRQMSEPWLPLASSLVSSSPRKPEAGVAAKASSEDQVPLRT